MAGFWKSMWNGDAASESADFTTLAELIAADAIQRANVSAGAALGVAAAFRARQLNADVPASLPIRAGDMVLPNTQHRIAETILALQDHGEAYWDLTDSDWSVFPHRSIRARWNADRTVRLYEHSDGRKLRTDGLVPNLHVLSVNRTADDLVGIGWMESKAVQGIIAIQNWSQTYFDSNAEPTGVFTVPGQLSSAEAKALKKQVTERAGDAGRSPLFVSGGMKWETTSFDAQASQWVESHDAGIRDISALSGVPTNFLAVAVAGSTLEYNNMSDIWSLYHRQTLHPTYIIRIEHALGAVLGTEVVFDAEQLLVSSIDQRVRSATELVRTGFEPEPSVDVAGLPPIAHTGEVPVTLQPDKERVSNVRDR